MRYSIFLSLSNKSQLLRLVRKHEKINSGVNSWINRYPAARQAVVEFLLMNYPIINDVQVANPILAGYRYYNLNKRLKEYRETRDIVSASFI